ncbi:MAG: hypothetical protein QXY74_05875 [Candidatus Bathyarchaeia archaeon]
MIEYTWSVTEVPSASQPPPLGIVPLGPYVRRFSFSQRLFKVLFSPKGCMEDVALTPSIGEVFGILAI